MARFSLLVTHTSSEPAKLPYRATSQRVNEQRTPVLPYTPSITRTYHQLLPYAFKRFSIRSAARTLLPTVGYYLSRPALPPSEKPALFTMNILPPMLTVWHHCAKKYLGDRVDIVAFDCSGNVDTAELPGMTVRKFINLYASTKCDEFIRNIARNRTTTWICDDDVFFLSDTAVDYVQREFADSKTATVSFRPRNWWEFEIDGKRIEPSGSYCLAINRQIFWEKERLTLAPADGNTHPSPRGPERRYDTFDKANEILLRKGYRCAILPKAERDQCITGFSGVSGGVMLLNHFKTPDQVLDYYRSPEKKAWAGSILPGTLCALLAICTVQECYQQITGKTYPLPSLPSRKELEKLQSDHQQLIRSDFSVFAMVEEATERLKKAL